MATRLSELPPTEHEYWELSECELKKMEEKSGHVHYFEKIENTREAKCKCGFGVFLQVEDYIEEGHLYRNAQLVY